MDELLKTLEWLESHNKNYTNEQYYKIQECLEKVKNYNYLEDYVLDVFHCMDGFSDKDGNLINDSFELTDEQIKSITKSLEESKQFDNIIEQLDYECIDAITNELYKIGISY